VNSSPELFAGVEKAAAAVDRERAKNKTTNEGDGPASRTYVNYPEPSVTLYK
jgi:hypothetical protein